MQPYQQAILQALSIPRYISQSDSDKVETVQLETIAENVEATETVNDMAYPQVSAQLLSDLSIAVNHTLEAEQVRFGSQLLLTSTHITLPYPITGTNKAHIYQQLCEQFSARI